MDHILRNPTLGITLPETPEPLLSVILYYRFLSIHTLTTKPSRRGSIISYFFDSTAAALYTGAQEMLWMSRAVLIRGRGRETTTGMAGYRGPGRKGLLLVYPACMCQAATTVCFAFFFPFFNSLGTIRLTSLMKVKPEQSTSHSKLCQEILPRILGAMWLGFPAREYSRS